MSLRVVKTEEVKWVSGDLVLEGLRDPELKSLTG